MASPSPDTCGVTRPSNDGSQLTRLLRRSRPALGLHGTGHSRRCRARCACRDLHESSATLSDALRSHSVTWSSTRLSRAVLAVCGAAAVSACGVHPAPIPDGSKRGTTGTPPAASPPPKHEQLTSCHYADAHVPSQ